MSEKSHEIGATRDQLRRFLLGALPEAEHAALEQRLASDEALRAALEDARAELSQLDLLPEFAPPPGLAERVIARVEAESEQAPAPFLRPPAWAALVAAAVIIAIALPYMGRAREAARRASTENNMKQLSLVFKMYANESRGERWPPAASIDGASVPDLRVLYPEYLTDATILLSAGRASEADRRLLAEALEQDPPDWDAAHRIVARHFVYTGYTLPDPETIEAFAVAALIPRDDDILREDGTRFHRLREGIERFFITDINNPAGSAQAQSSIPVLIHRGGRADRITVLYMDGHIAEVARRDEPELFAALERLLTIQQ